MTKHDITLHHTVMRYSTLQYMICILLHDSALQCSACRHAYMHALHAFRCRLRLELSFRLHHITPHHVMQAKAQTQTQMQRQTETQANVDVEVGVEARPHACMP